MDAKSKLTTSAESGLIILGIVLQDLASVLPDSNWYPHVILDDVKIQALKGIGLMSSLYSITG